jgi:hypothetical protein
MQYSVGLGSDPLSCRFQSSRIDIIQGVPNHSVTRNSTLWDARLSNTV